MLSNKDYTKMTMDELVTEEKKLKSQKIMTAVFVGFMIGVAVYTATHQGFIKTVMFLIFAYLIGSGYAKSVKQVEAEISRRNAEPGE